MAKGNWALKRYTSRDMIVAVESGAGRAREWVKEEGNYYGDYRKLFGKEPPKLGALALMTDSDDTRNEESKFYGDIFLESAR